MLPFSPLKIAHIIGHLAWASVTRPRFADYKPDDAEHFYPDPYPVFKRMTAEAPIFYSPRIMAWVISDSYETVIGLMKDERFSLSFKDWKFAPQKPEPKKNALDHVTDSLLMSMNKQNHMRVRKLAMPAFSPRIVDNMRADILAVVKRHFDSVAGNDSFDFALLSKAIPLEILSKYIGVSENYQQELAGLSHAILANYDPKEQFDLKLALDGIDMLKRLVAERRAAPRDDFLSVMATTVEDGDRLSETEMLALIASVLAAGPDSTRDHLNSLACTLLRNPAVMQEVHDNPALIDDAIRECFRVNNWGHSGSTRFALQDVELLGQTIRKGEMVRLMFPCAMYDASVFPEPDTLNIHRDNLEKVVFFGVGSHYCLGAALARTITEEVLGELVRRYPRASLAAEPLYRRNMISRRMQALWVKTGIH